MKELAGVDKDVDEEEDLGLLEQEASMPLHELLAKMKEVCKRFKFYQRGNTAHSLQKLASLNMYHICVTFFPSFLRYFLQMLLTQNLTL